LVFICIPEALVAAGAIHLLEGASLWQSATAGAIDMHNNVVNNDILPGASILLASGATTFVKATVSPLRNCGGTWNNGSISNTITVYASGVYFFNTNGCGSTISTKLL
jgi:hypothetical protein